MARRSIRPDPRTMEIFEEIARSKELSVNFVVAWAAQELLKKLVAAEQVSRSIDDREDGDR